jgi:predicted RNA-binding Zn-ribbon protein involved in translation (DUF1610 family)
VALSYHISCPACGAEWPGLEARGSELPPGEAAALASCPECFSLRSVTVRLTVEELAKYRRELLKTVQKMYQGYTKARMRLEERRRVLAEQVRHGAREHQETVRLLEKRLASLTPPDTAHLDARAKELAEIEQAAPREPEALPCPDCGTPATIHRETHRGFELPCARCMTRLRVELKGG